MNKLEQYRNELDIIDKEITSLYEKRMNIVLEIAKEKKASNVPTNVPDREKNIINKVTKMVSPELRVYTKQLYETIFQTSKSYQSRVNATDGNLRNLLTDLLAKDKEFFPKVATVACQGVLGSYSSIATERLFQISDITYCKTFENVFEAVETGKCKFGILPIENSTAGSVNAVYDLMKKHEFYIVGGIKISVRHCLLGNKGTKKEDITEIISHEQALNQCSEYLKKFPNAKIVPVANTAVASKTVAESGRHDIASISSKECSDYYGLSIIDGDIADNQNNYTRFICISKEPTLYTNSTKISLMAALPHEAGSLSKILGRFNASGINLTKLESRPTQNSVFEFMFYFDIEGDIHDPEVFNLLCDLDNSINLTFLGAYNEL